MKDCSYEILDLWNKYEGNTEAALAGETSPQCLYAFSPLRENLFEWMEFPKEARILQIGSDYGACTGLLAGRSKVTAVLDPRDENLEVNRLRHGQRENVVYIRGDLFLGGRRIYKPREDAGQEDDFIDPRSALSIITKETLCIVVDTYQVGQVECKEILEKCGKIAVIDHHRKGVGYIENAVLVCHEPYASSASELVTELLQYVGSRDDKPTRIEAEGLLAGIMLDTRNFSLHTGVRTFEAAAALRRYGAETERAWSLFDVSLTEYNAKAGLVAKAQMYKGCAIVLSGELPAEAQVAVPQAANDLLSIEGVQASFVAVQAGSLVKISARSMGQVNVQVVMESLGGGGHQTMAATVLKHTSLEQARVRLNAAIDAYRASQKKGNVKA